MLWTPGTPRIALCDPHNERKLLTQYLPICDPGYPKYDPSEVKILKTLIQGSNRNRRLGWVPQLTMRWEIYLDQIQASLTEGATVGAWGFVMGPLDGQMPTMADLLNLLSAPPGGLKVSPGPSAGGFIAEDWTVKAIGVNQLGLATGLEIEFVGRNIQQTPALWGF